MEPELIKIKCPNCGAILAIKNIPGLESKTIPCPVCKKVSLYTEYKSPVQKQRHSPEEDDTDTEDTTWLPNTRQTTIGKLQAIGSKDCYPLKQGKNTIGRKALTSKACIQIETNDGTMSREHAVIEVRTTSMGYSYCFYNDKNKNPSYVNSLLVEQQDRIILTGDETIRMGDTLVRFINETIEDKEHTLYKKEKV